MNYLNTWLFNLNHLLEERDIHKLVTKKENDKTIRTI